MPNDLEAERKALAKQRREIEREREALKRERRDLDRDKDKKKKKKRSRMMMMNQGKDIEVKRPRYHPWRPTLLHNYTETRCSRATSSRLYNGSRSHHPSNKNSAATSKRII